MRYQPKPGDRVTSPLLVGEWEFPVDYRWNLAPYTPLYARVTQGRAEALVPLADLTPVAPRRYPPEPAVGEVVWARGRYWQRWRTGDYDSEIWGARLNLPDSKALWSKWDYIAADAEPVVPVSKVAEWLDGHGLDATTRTFRAEFGWDK